MPLKARRAGRRLAIDVLYEAEIRETPPAEAFRRREKEGWVNPTSSEDEQAALLKDSEGAPDPVAREYALTLIEGVETHQAELDGLIGRYADRWAIERMPIVDRTLLRIALFELGWREDVPVAVAINEAVELAKSLSTEDSGRFINGLLGRVVEERALGERPGRA